MLGGLGYSLWTLIVIRLTLSLKADELAKEENAIFFSIKSKLLNILSNIHNLSDIEDLFNDFVKFVISEHNLTDS
jgi:hypothetical protein